MIGQSVYRLLSPQGNGPHVLGLHIVASWLGGKSAIFGLGKKAAINISGGRVPAQRGLKKVQRGPKDL